MYPSIEIGEATIWNPSTDDSDSQFDDMLILDLLNGRFSTKTKTEFKVEAKPDKINIAKKKKYRTRDRKICKKVV